MTDPQLQKIAMDHMSRMTPEQLGQICGMMGNISPDALKRFQQHVSQMSQSDRDKLKERMQNTDPSSIPYASSAQQARQEYAYQASMQLKDEGNRLLKQGNIMGAVEKYEHVTKNLKLALDEKSCDLVTVCTLNTALCYLKLELYEQCISKCTEVLKVSPKNVKALYRRGQAYLHQKQYRKALVDLQQTLDLTPNDPAERKPIEDKLDQVRELMGDEIVEETVEEDDIVEEIPSHQVADRGDTSEQNQTLEENIRRSADVVSQMSDDQIRQMSQISGIDVSPEMVRSAQSALKTMDADTIAQMATVVDKMNSGRSDQNTHAATSTQMSSPQMHQAYETLQNDPDMIRKRAESMKNLSQEELDRLAEISGHPDGMKPTPEMMKRVAESLSQMDDDHLRRLPTVMQSIHANDSSSTSMPTTSVTSGEPSTASTSATSPAMGMTPETMKLMNEMMSNLSADDIKNMFETRVRSDGNLPSVPGNFSDPATIERCFKMLNSMDEDLIVQMMTSSGFQCSEGHARTMARQMKSMSPAQMALMTKAVSYGQRGIQTAKKVKQWLLGRTALIIAILAILIGLVLRLYGLM